MPRPLLLAVLCLAALAPVAAGDEAIPYDAKKAKAITDRDRAWVETTTRTAYRTVGRRDPKWDTDVEAAFRANLDRLYAPVWARPVADAKFRTALQFAGEAGCDDPLVGYLRLRYPSRPADAEDVDERHEPDFLTAARALGASKYPPTWKARALLDAIALRSIETKDREACLDELFKLLATAAKDKDPSARRELVELCDTTHRNGAPIGKRKAWFDRLETEVLAGLPKTDPMPHVCAGKFLVRYAWDARGGGLANTVTPAGGKLFNERLTEAEKRLTAAWEADSECAAAAAEMVTVCMGLGRDRGTMEKWFRRAVAADPAQLDVFDRKMNYLHPKWHGSANDLLAFGRAAAKLGQWDTALPLYLLQAHRQAAPPGGREQEDYFRNADVWTEVGPVLEEIRKRHPNSPLGASAYLYYAWQCERNAAEALQYVRAQTVPLSVGLFPSNVLVAAAEAWAEGKARSKD